MDTLNVLFFSSSPISFNCYLINAISDIPIGKTRKGNNNYESNDIDGDDPENSKGKWNYSVEKQLPFEFSRVLSFIVWYGVFCHSKCHYKKLIVLWVNNGFSTIYCYMVYVFAAILILYDSTDSLRFLFERKLHYR